jgi:beta-phosphoglucomutase-like phosphatase (HAD superfamily)
MSDATIGFDWDGTLVQSWTATPLPCVRERLAVLPEGTRTFIATNQAGPVWRRVTGDTKYPTVEDIAGRIIAGLAALDWKPDALFIATCAGERQDYTWFTAAQEAMKHLYDLLEHVAYVSVSAMPIDRKPGGGMLRDAAEHFDRGCLSAGHMLYIGDMETDHQAATHAGCRYLDAAAWRERGLNDE